MAENLATTLVTALLDLPEREGRGFTCVRRDGSEKSLSWRELKAAARATGKILKTSLGVVPGDRVVVVLPEPDDFVVAFFGCVLAGAVPVPLANKAPFRAAAAYRDHLAHILRASGAKLILTDRQCAEAAELSLLDAELGRDTSEPTSRSPMSTAATARVTVADVDTLGAQLGQISAAGDFDQPALPSPDDLCFLQFTSGSTSEPKGVRVLHRNLVANARAFLGPAGLDRTDADLGLSWLPLYHDMGLIGFVLGPVICDISVVLIATERFAKLPRSWLEEISARGATITFAPNFAYRLVTRRVRERDLERLNLRSLRIAGCGAEPIQAETLVSFAERFAPCGFNPIAFAPCYGMAESTLAISFTRPNDPLAFEWVDTKQLAQGQAVVSQSAQRPEATTPGTHVQPVQSQIVDCGQPFPGHEVHVVREDGAVADEREVGEVWVRGPSVADGYEGLSSPDTFDPDGWLHTGDLGYFAENHLFICGRLKDMIIVNGSNHFPQDIEWLVAGVEGVREGGVVAFGLPGTQGDEIVVVAETRASDAGRVRDEAARRVAAEMGVQPSVVAAVPPGTIPKTSSGKIQRRRTRQLYQNGALSEHGTATETPS